MLDPLGRDGDIILTPANTLKVLLEAFEKKDWQQVYTFVAEGDVNGEGRPEAVEDFIALVTGKDVTLEAFSVLDQSISADGQTVLVMMNYTMVTKDGDAPPSTNFPVILIKENDLWKVSYASFKQMLSIE